MKDKHLYIILAGGFILIIYAISASILYRKALEEDLQAKAREQIAATGGLEEVAVEFDDFDVNLSGKVASRDLVTEAEQIIASLSGLRVASNSIEFPEPEPPPPSIRQPKSPPLPPTPPPPPKPSTLTLVSNGDRIILSGSVADVTVKKRLMQPFALTDVFFQLDAGKLKINPKVVRDDWPDDLPPVLAMLATRSRQANLALTDRKLEVKGTTFNQRTARQLDKLIRSLSMGEREITVDVKADSLPALPDEGFALQSRFDEEQGQLTLTGRVKTDEAKNELIQIVKEDLPGTDLIEEIEIDEGIESPEFSARLPNMLSLIHTRTRFAAGLATNEGFHVFGEMREELSQDDLAETLRLMLGPEPELKHALLPHAAPLFPEE